MQEWLFYGILRGSCKWDRPGAWLLHQYYTWKHAPVAIYPNRTPRKKKKRKYIFIVVTKFLQEFLLSLLPLVFGVIFFPSCSWLPCLLKYVVLCISPNLNTSATWHTVYSQESNFLKKTLFIVFGLKLRIWLHFPVGGSCSQIWHQAYEGFDSI